MAPRIGISRAARAVVSAVDHSRLIRPGVMPNIPNAISLLRLLATPVLLAMTVMDRQQAFRWLLVASLISDIADGLIARGFKITSRIGALLDSTADILVSAIGTFAVFKFRAEFVSQHFGPVLLVIVLYLLAVAAEFLRYGRLASFHTIACRVAAYAQGIFVVLLLFRGFNGTLFCLMIGISAAAYLEEIVLVWLLPTWSTDVGGLYWVLRK
jgi:phosphatidylglycerophosphate synthase